MPIKQPAIFVLSILAFLTALGALSPLLLLCGIFVLACALWAAVRMPPFWRYARTEPRPEELSGIYELQAPFDDHKEYTLELAADGVFLCERFPLFTVWPPVKIEHALRGSGHWVVEQQGKREWMVTLALDESEPVEMPGRSEGSGLAVDHMQVSFRIGRRKGAFTLMTWAGGFLRGQTVEFHQRLANVAPAVLAGSNAEQH